MLWPLTLSSAPTEASDPTTEAVAANGAKHPMMTMLEDDLCDPSMIEATPWKLVLEVQVSDGDQFQNY